MAEQKTTNQLSKIVFMLLSVYMNPGSGKIKTKDRDVRDKLISHLSKKQRDTYLLEEFNIERGIVRADVVEVSNGRVHGYEIKSDSDTLSRLPKQVKYYNQVFSTVTLVVGREHIVNALYMIPDWWGVMVATSECGVVRLNTIRESKENNNIEYNAVADLLHKNELRNMLKSYAPEKTYSHMTKDSLRLEAATCLPGESIMRLLSTRLVQKSRASFLNLKISF